MEVLGLPKPAYNPLSRPSSFRSPIADRHVAAAEDLAGMLRGRNPRVEVDGSDSRMQNKIRLAQKPKAPHTLVLGDRDFEGRSVAIRKRTGEQENGVTWDAFIDRLAEETAARRP